MDSVTNSTVSDPDLQQYAPVVVKLFNNMKIHASIFSAAMISIGFVRPLPEVVGAEPRAFAVLRQTYLLATCLAFCSECLAVTWATMAIHQLTADGDVVEPAESAWHLVRRDYDLPWSAVNSHFVLGMLGFMWMIGTRVVFMSRANGSSRAVRTSAVSVVAAASVLMVSIVNRGLQRGGEEGVITLFLRYIVLLTKQVARWENFGPLELGFLVLSTVSIVSGLYGLLNETRKKIKSE